MRIADKMTYDQVQTNLMKNRTDMATSQNEASTQKRVNRPSDDPLAAARVLGTRTDINVNQQFLKNINVAKSFLEYSEQSLSELNDVLVRAKELAISQSNDASASQQTRRVTATEIHQLHDQSVQIGNRKLGDRFLFGGFKTTSAPFNTAGKYLGDEGEMEIFINKEAKISMNVPGSRVFLGKKVHAQELEDSESQPPEKNEYRMRGPASIASKTPSTRKDETEESQQAQSELSPKGINIFRVLKNLEISLEANDKVGVQDTLDKLDDAIAQVILMRSQLGSRSMTINGAIESLQKAQVDAKTTASSLEDIDSFEVVSDLNKSESTLKASLATSGKLIQPSLLDFLR